MQNYLYYYTIVHIIKYYCRYQIFYVMYLSTTTIILAEIELISSPYGWIVYISADI